ncbi:MAG: P-loop NTPase fold protein [Veillonella sp.]|jgi:KAP P-loop protein|uniref:KAP family P-loop NTPase fold protein n=1 Tax=Veillonella sp. TaxID=1926307 RepID=UPI0029017855|nr:P-loop NTPase fold protein [Veillonella sp.]MDU1938871.1 P-loop NTPase fold protein [Veillonella sp.]
MDIQKHASDFSAENLRKSYINNILNRNTYIHSFISMLLNIEKGGVIAIDGEWGSGKTHFVQQVKWLLDSASENITSDVKTVLNNTSPKLDNLIGHKYKAFYYDAWKHDKSNNPFFTLLRTMILAFGGIDYFKDETSFINSLLKGASHIVKGVTPIDAELIFKGTKALCGINDAEQFSELEFIEQMDNQVDSFLDYICEGQYDKLVVFIDELDRCRPSFAVELLEIIKHYFNNDKVIFVLSTNLSEFQYCIKQYYGDGFNGWKYLDRFIDLRLTVPTISTEDYYKYLWQKTGTDRIDDISIACAKYFGFNLRDIQRYNQQVNIAFHSYINTIYQNNDFSEELDSLYAVFTPILLALKLYSVEEFKDFISGKKYEIIKGLLKKERFRRSALFFILRANQDLSSEREALLERALEYCYNKLFNSEVYYSSSKNSIDDLMLNHFNIDSNTRSNLLNIINLFSGKVKFDI